jgi:hypothetical protein
VFTILLSLRYGLCLSFFTLFHFLCFQYFNLLAFFPSVIRYNFPFSFFLE